MIFLQYLKTLAICRGVCFIGLTSAFAQTTEFTYQGRLVDGSLPANTPHDFEFRLFTVKAILTEV